MNWLYFANLIPPLPLSLKDAGIYQSLSVNAPGRYTVQYEDQGPLAFFRWSDTVHVMSGSELYAYTAVFSPASFNVNIIHDWQFYDPAQKQWITRTRISLPVSGGQDGGWRTFSFISKVTPGSWRVNVETPTGAVIGQLRFEAVVVSSSPQLATKDIN